MIHNEIHDPVMLHEVLEALAPKDGKVYVDGTFGAGGYSAAIVKQANCKVYGIDRDPHVKILADELKEKFPGRIEFLVGCFGDMRQLLGAQGVNKVDGIVLDIGVSSMQIDDGMRGFSFKQDGPLDMRMSGEGLSAADVVNSMDEGELADIIFQLGGEKKSRRVAKAIVNARAKGPIVTTKQLADIVRSVVKMAGHQIDPATRTFQALRIWVNDELGELSRALEASEELLNPGGRVVVVTFHSLEDGIVKRFFKEKAGQVPGISRHIPVANENIPAVRIFSIVTKKAVVPSETEIKRNLRSRSAKLRAAEKLQVGE
jgi:16S rRNA (cytosine1402-N4)-methyltransferase